MHTCQRSVTVFSLYMCGSYSLNHCMLSEWTDFLISFALLFHLCIFIYICCCSSSFHHHMLSESIKLFASDCAVFLLYMQFIYTCISFSLHCHIFSTCSSQCVVLPFTTVWLPLATFKLRTASACNFFIQWEIWY